MVIAMNKSLAEIMRRADAWPESAREEIVDLARKIEAELNAGAYRATPEELAGIDRGLRDAAGGKFATNEQVEAEWGTFHRALDKPPLPNQRLKALMAKKPPWRE